MRNISFLPPAREHCVFTSTRRTATGCHVIDDGIQVSRTAHVPVENEVGSGRRDEICAPGFSTILLEEEILIEEQGIKPVLLSGNCAGPSVIEGRRSESRGSCNVMLPQDLRVIREQHVRFKFKPDKGIRPVCFTHRSDTGRVPQQEQIFTEWISEARDELRVDRTRTCDCEGSLCPVLRGSRRGRRTADRVSCLVCFLGFPIEILCSPHT